ncbi:hypothetical protein L2E82_05612 [Cichorium intybus]|uniref:Uncharacterized protein n=1 Tax=Cichorium intybus TaxID=13427 RepID=A0ACB9H9B1_CICIN|nr:hypothetical protein L2E82_05612 [Cichorium intybus]
MTGNSPRRRKNSKRNRKISLRQLHRTLASLEQDFTLPSHMTIFEVDTDRFEEHPSALQGGGDGGGWWRQRRWW